MLNFGQSRATLAGNAFFVLPITPYRSAPPYGLVHMSSTSAPGFEPGPLDLPSIIWFAVCFLS